MFEFMTKILSDGNFVKIYLTSGESFILNELDGEAEGVIFGSRDASGRKACYGSDGCRNWWQFANTGKKKKDTAVAVSFTI